MHGRRFLRSHFLRISVVKKVADREGFDSMDITVGMPTAMMAITKTEYL